MRLPTTAILVMLAMVYGGSMGAQEDTAVRNAVLAHYEAVNAGDIPTVIEQHAANFNGFLGDGAPLVHFKSRDAQRKAWIDESTIEFVSDLTVRDIVVEVVGDVAVAMFYLDGSWGPKDDPQHGPFRVTEVWVKQDGGWKELHHHDSPLR